jgi:hypothetical protein
LENPSCDRKILEDNPQPSLAFKINLGSAVVVSSGERPWGIGMARKPTIREFLLVAWRDWRSLVSGGFSVPFSIATVLADTKYAQVIFLLLSLTAAAACAYQIWRDEREKVVALEAKVAPQIVLKFENEYPYVYERRVNDVEYLCCRFLAINGGVEALTSCRAELARVVQDDGIKAVNIPFSLQRSITGLEETFVLRPGQEQYVDLMAIPKLLRPGLPIAIAQWGESWPEIGVKGAVMPHEPCTMTIQVLSEAPPARMTLRFECRADTFAIKPLATPAPPPSC